MNFVVKNILFLTILIFSLNKTAYSLDISDKDSLKELGYNWNSFYKDNYRGKKTKWFSLEDHLNLKPKFLALVEQDLKLNGKRQKYLYVYNSRHNFFKMEIQGQKKKIAPKIINPLSKRYLAPKLIDDTNMALSEFIEKVLDHCKFSKSVAVIDKSGKKLNFRDEEECRIIRINRDDFKNLTYNNFEKNQNLKSYNPKFADNLKKKDKEKERKIDHKKKIQTNLKSFKTAIAVSWDRKYDLLAGELSYDYKKNNGIIKFVSNSNEKCFGTFNLINDKGTWSFSCEGSDSRAFGEIFLKENFIEGEGKDNKKNKIKFISNAINE